MIIKYDIDISNSAIVDNLNRLVNQIFKLLPSREEGGDWKSPLENLILEVGGLSSLLYNQSDLLLLLSKMEGLLTLNEEKDFLMFRKTIFECLSLIDKVKKCLA